MIEEDFTEFFSCEANKSTADCSRFNRMDFCDNGFEFFCRFNNEMRGGGIFFAFPMVFPMVFPMAFLSIFPMTFPLISEGRCFLGGML